jgi:hypothetical protein
LRKTGIAAEFGKRDASPTRNRIIELHKIPRPDTLGGPGGFEPDRTQNNVFTFPKKQ